MDDLLLSKRQLLVWVLICAVLTGPFFVWTAEGQIKNEGALIFLVPCLAGMPWVLLYSALPFDIPGFTSAGVPDEMGDLKVTVFQVTLLMLPVWFNIYLAVRFISGGRAALSGPNDR